MPSISPSQARNFIRRALLEVADPSPKLAVVDEIWKHFGNSCAYCGTYLDRTKKEGHIDHLIASSADGVNGRVNRVLSCAGCNEAEKRESHWREFLNHKISDGQIRDERVARIEAWISGHDLNASDAEIRPRHAAAAKLAEEVIASFNTALNTVRDERGQRSTRDAT